MDTVHWYSLDDAHHAAEAFIGYRLREGELATTPGVIGS
jgi:hypothetical protein